MNVDGAISLLNKFCERTGLTPNDFLVVGDGAKLFHGLYKNVHEITIRTLPKNTETLTTVDDSKVFWSDDFGHFTISDLPNLFLEPTVTVTGVRYTIFYGFRTIAADVILNDFITRDAMMRKINTLLDIRTAVALSREIPTSVME